VSWNVVFTEQAGKDVKKLSASGLRLKAEAIIQILDDEKTVKVIHM
jgi:mRNA-degrading endonuclease RelE of RelBE toxin-antitoxin system